MEEILKKLDQPQINTKHGGDLKFWKEVYLSFNKTKISVLEWGGGASSIYFPIFLKTKNIESDWDVIENDEKWIKYIEEKVKKEGLKNVHVHYGHNRDSYSKLPLKFNKKYDLIIIDGSWRKSCIKRLPLLLKEGGSVIVHDAHWMKGRLDVLDYLDGKYVGTRTWIGKLIKK